MGISPWYSGATLPQWQVTLVDDAGDPLNLTGATLSLLIYNTETGVETTGAGTWNITNASAGQATYAWSATDSAVPGKYALRIKATYAGGFECSDPIPWQVTSS
jgi:hypothetical protein